VVSAPRHEGANQVKNNMKQGSNYVFETRKVDNTYFWLIYVSLANFHISHVGENILKQFQKSLTSCTMNWPPKRVMHFGVNPYYFFEENKLKALKMNEFSSILRLIHLHFFSFTFTYFLTSKIHTLKVYMAWSISTVAQCVTLDNKIKCLCLLICFWQPHQ
jgi:hypothetical protein